MNARSLMLATLLAAWSSPAAFAQVQVPSEFESPTANLSRLFSYFGGVQSYGVNHSAATIHSGSSLEVWCNFRPDPFGFTVAGFGVGTYGVPVTPAAIPDNADTFSVTIQAPPSGQLSFFITVREDDNGDNAIDVAGDDDEWESALTLLGPGTAVYNIPYSAFVDVDPGAGNGVRNFNTTGRLAYFITIETRAAYPGGMVTTPVTLRLDHMGFYAGAQTIPAPSCPADHNATGGVTTQDIFDFLDDWLNVRAAADFNRSGSVSVQDIYDFFAAWHAGCP